jgi:hypothetical protein
MIDSLNKLADEWSVDLVGAGILFWFFLHFTTFTDLQFTRAEPWAFAAAGAIGISRGVSWKGGNGSVQAKEPQAP